MTLKIFLMIAFVFILPAEAVRAAEPGTPAVVIEKIWIQETSAKAKTAAGYLSVQSPVGDRLIGLKTPRAAKVELHNVGLDNGVMRMREMENGLYLPPGKSISLSPGGDHVMFLGIEGPYKAGEIIPLTLIFERAAEQTIDVEVRPLSRLKKSHH